MISVCFANKTWGLKFCGINIGKPQELSSASWLANAWYSPTMAKTHGSIFYRHHKTGEDVELTQMTLSANSHSEYSDSKFVGIVNHSAPVRVSDNFPRC